MESEARLHLGALLQAPGLVRTQAHALGGAAFLQIRCLACFWGSWGAGGGHPGGLGVPVGSGAAQVRQDLVQVERPGLGLALEAVLLRVEDLGFMDRSRGFGIWSRWRALGSATPLKPSCFGR